MIKFRVIAILLVVSTVIPSGLSNPAIGFYAVLNNDVTLTNNQTIKYSRVLTNYGNGYDKWSGHFAAPRRGLYVFACSVKAENTDGITVELIKNGHRMMKISSAYSPWESGSSTVVLALNYGDSIWVQRHAHGRRIIKDYNSFSGYLISAEI